MTQAKLQIPPDVHKLGVMPPALYAILTEDKCLGTEYGEHRQLGTLVIHQPPIISQRAWDTASGSTIIKKQMSPKGQRLCTILHAVYTLGQAMIFYVARGQLSSEQAPDTHHYTTSAHKAYIHS